MSRVLLSGFEPFGGESVNPSAQVVHALASEHRYRDLLDTVVLPVDRARAAEQLLARLRAARPRVVLMLGEAGGRARITPERVAINVDDYRAADNAGHRPRGEPVVDGGPVGYFSTLPLATIVAGLLDAGFPAEISNSAGTYLCNHVFYRVMHHLAESRERVRAGFMHLPYVHEQVLDKPDAPPSMALETLVRAVGVAIDVARASRS